MEAIVALRRRDTISAVGIRRSTRRLPLRPGCRTSRRVWNRCCGSGGDGSMSLDITGFILVVEDEFKVSIPDEDYETIVTVKDLCRYVENRTNSVARSEFVFERLRQLISEEFSIPIDEIHPESRFVDDLRID
jgi:acyl carrier protein